MTLDELKDKVLIAADQCQRIIERNPNVILSESDFEKLFSRCISYIICENICSPMDEDFSVHTQLSHYLDEKKHSDIRPDIILLKESKIKELLRTDIIRKDFKYEGPSIAIELKYFHSKDDITKINHDFEKWMGRLNENTYLFVVALIDVSPRSRRNTFKNRKARILKTFDRMSTENRCENFLFCKVMKKVKSK